MSTPRQSTSIKPQSILFWVFLILSLPLTIAVVLYVSGYRFDSNSGEVVVSAALAIETEPKDATVVLNGTVQEDTTPYINTFEAGEYVIEVQLDGFLPWKKQLVIDEGKSVLFPNVLLFRDHEPLDVAAPVEVDNAFRALTNAEVAYYTSLDWAQPQSLRVSEGPQTILVDPEQQVSYVVDRVDSFSDAHRIESALTDVSWNKENVLLYATGPELWLYNPALDEYVLLTRRGATIADVEWHPDGGYVFFSDPDGLYTMELDPRDHRQLWQLSNDTAPLEITVSSSGEHIQYSTAEQRRELSLFE